MPGHVPIEHPRWLPGAAGYRGRNRGEIGQRITPEG
jgi:hypothetical protein